MATIAGITKILVPDVQLRVTSANSFNGTAALKGTATDLLLTIATGVDGTSAFAGNVTYIVQGSNDGSTYTAVTPDKGALNSDTAANKQSAHFAQLAYKQYRVVYFGASSPLMNSTAVYNYHPVADTVDATVA